MFEKLTKALGIAAVIALVVFGFYLLKSTTINMNGINELVDGTMGLASALLFMGLAFVIYFFPTIAAYRRGSPHKDGVMVVNLFLGWTFIGWVVALAWACATPIKDRPN